MCGWGINAVHRITELSEYQYKVRTSISRDKKRREENHDYWRCTARVESRKGKPNAEKREESLQNYHRRLCAPMNGVCKITIALAGLESRGRKRKAWGIRGII